MKSKPELRKHFRSLLKNQEAGESVPEAQSHDRKLCDHLVQHLKNENGVWAAFQPTGFEPDIRAAFSRLHDITWVFPRIEGEELSFYKPHGPTTLILNKWGILEPDPSRAEKVDFLSVRGLLIPALAFDLQLNRLGRGGGFYDRALAKFVSAHHPVIKLGIARDLQISDETFPSESFDIPMDQIVTETRVLTKSPIHSRKTS